MMVKKLSVPLLSVGLLLGFAGSSGVSTLLAQSAPSSPASPSSPTPSAVGAGKPAAVSTPYRNQPNRIANREAAYYQAVWGIEAPSVKAVESGVILRFSYRVLDPAKAKALNDKKVNPALISPDKGLKLEIPSLENVGQLRQTSTPEAGRSYWMAFSNSGRLLKRGDRVDIVIGNFHARGLLIE